ncbi:DUF2076 domain-containing protein [Comamonas sp. Y33R10-2]|uniref:DUF2076 domain-containing protein n=1 Tax=Comamonas sp. Y33R10-2 TaxID=2853257 RepID=UPI001C5C83BC|nr:DUF2076 domain-containing protein [Comamonas sp. Y33R10-2]QXZ09667.1 DUF2076 domain-containing protein [Comamonas sp. Y33R10-2]
MTSQEQQLLQDLCARLTLTQGQPKDPQADAELRSGLTAAPDAVYWLAQRTLLLEQSLQQAQKQITELQQQVQQAQQNHSQAGSSFLSGGLSTHFGRAPEPSVNAASAQQPYQSPNQFQPAVQASSWRDRFSGSAASSASPNAVQPAAPAGGSFLGSAVAAAAGVAGGMFLFNGLGNLMGSQHASSANPLASSESKPLAEGSSAQSLHEGGGTSSLADDAGLGSIDSAASGSWDDGGGFFDDDFA